MQGTSPAVFLDRDGTIIEDIGYIRQPDQIKFLPGSIEAIKQLHQAGYKVVVITNQAGVARGLMSENIIQTIDKLIHRAILNGGTHLDAIYYCPHHPEHGAYPYRQECECRKPHPGLIKKAEKDLNLDLKRSFMVGDKGTDIQAGQRAGIKTVFVLTGRGKKELEEIPVTPDEIAADLLTAAKWILAQPKG